jgi:hypothetical protein
MLGKKFTDFQTPEQARHDMLVFLRLMNGESIKGYETVHIGKSGNSIHLVFNANAIRDVMVLLSAHAEQPLILPI